MRRKLHLNKNNRTLTNEVKKLGEELAKKCKRTDKGKEEHTKLQNEAKLLGKTVKRYEDNIAVFKATIAKQENKLNRKLSNPNNGTEVDNEIGSDNEEFSKGVTIKDLLKSIDEILQSKLVALEETLKETMANEIGKNKQNIDAKLETVIKENKTYAKAAGGTPHTGRAETTNATDFKSILREARNDQLIEDQEREKRCKFFYYSWSSRERY